MTPTAHLGLMIGAFVGLGLVLTIARVPLLRQPRLHDRIHPYVKPVPPPDVNRGLTPIPLLGGLFRPALADAAQWMERLLGGGTAVAARLRASGSSASVEQFRAEQFLLASGGVLVGLGLGVGLLANGSLSSPVVAIGMAVTLGVGGVLLRDMRLTRSIRRREELMLAELPAVADLLALSVAAGEGPVAALRRVCRLGDGALTDELRLSLNETHSGVSLVDALDSAAGRSTVPALQRFVDGIAVSLERGTPLSDVLRAQAADVREARKRSLMEAGGRKEVAMLVPVVFLILPVTVMFALFPGIAQFNMIVG